MIAVINSGPLIALAKLNELRVLPALYGTVIIPQAVYTEAVVVGLARGYQDAKLAQIFLKRMRWAPEPITEVPAALAAGMRLGSGEREAIALAKQHQMLLLIDEAEARTLAEDMGITTAGTLGILVEAYHKGLFDAEAFTDLLSVIESREDIWIHTDLCQRVRSDVLGLK